MIALESVAASCDEVCNPSVPCDTECNGTTAEEPWETTCGAHDGGAANGWCEGSCGDGVCDVGSGEDHDSCFVDCVEDLPHLERVRFPEDGRPWASRMSNWPDKEAVDSCYGNCGAGCTEQSVCDSRFQYWELEIVSGVNQNTQQTCFCADNDNLLECGSLTTYSATGRWTYYGWSALGCYAHDTTCRVSWWSGVGFGILSFIVYPGHYLAQIWIQTVFNPILACKLSRSSFLLGGACQEAGPQEWAYYQTVTTDEFDHDHFEYGPTGTCYSGPPMCGDGICQENGCLLGESGAGNAPGNGCEEDTYNCSSDCS
jgi:hypothetical protein